MKTGTQNNGSKYERMTIKSALNLVFFFVCEMLRCVTFNPVTYLEDVPRAVMSACNRPAMKTKGLFLVMTK